MSVVEEQCNPKVFRSTEQVPTTIVAIYHFAHLEDGEAVREKLYKTLAANGILGTLLIAPSEGINGTIGGPSAGIDIALAEIKDALGTMKLQRENFTYCDYMPFIKLRVRMKKETVTMGVPDVDPGTAKVGEYVKPQGWNDTLSRDDVVVIDTRNDYETNVGTFRGSIIPNTKSFSDFPQWWEQHREEYDGKKVAMFCTGGIRCEKASTFLVAQGIEVFHLEGGILTYLKEVEKEKSMFDGECFVFDRRVTVAHGGVPGSFEQCRACRRPLTEDIKALPGFENGVSCNNCLHEYTEEDRRRFRQRQEQIEKAAEKGELHLGGFPLKPKKMKPKQGRIEREVQ